MNHLSELQNSKKQHATKQAEKVNGNRSIRKRHDEREANPNEANPCKVNQIMYLPKYIPSTKKRKKHVQQKRERKAVLCNNNGLYPEKIGPGSKGGQNSQQCTSKQETTQPLTKAGLLRRTQDVGQRFTYTEIANQCTIYILRLSSPTHTEHEANTEPPPESYATATATSAGSAQSDEQLPHASIESSAQTGSEHLKTNLLVGSQIAHST